MGNELVFGSGFKITFYKQSDGRLSVIVYDEESGYVMNYVLSIDEIDKLKTFI